MNELGVLRMVNEKHKGSDPWLVGLRVKVIYRKKKNQIKKRTKNRH